MAILKDDILTFVKKALKEDGFVDADIEEEIKATLADLSKYNLLTATPVDIAGVDGDTNFDEPLRFKRLISITPNDGSNDKLPLLPIKGGFRAYRQLVSGTQSNSSGNPELYTRQNKKFWIYPTLTKSFTFTVEYYINSAGDVDAIEFSDDFINAIKYGTAYHAALFRKKSSYVDIWLPIYIAERGSMIAMNPPEPTIVQ